MAAHALVCMSLDMPWDKYKETILTVESVNDQMPDPNHAKFLEKYAENRIKST